MSLTDHPVNSNSPVTPDEERTKGAGSCSPESANPSRTTQAPWTMGGSRYSDGVTTDEITLFFDPLFDPADLVVVRPIETWIDAAGRKNSDVKWKAQEVLYPGQLKSEEGWRSWLAFAERERANLFFGVCPRYGCDNLYNAAWQIRVVRALWADVDGCTPEEVLVRCREANVPDPSILVNSGNGTHGYWLLDEIYWINDVPPPPPVVSEFVVQADGRRKRRPYFLDENGAKVYKMPRVSPKGETIQRTLAGIAQAIGGDHTIDLARLLRLPGTLNRKDQRNGRPPVPCSLVACDATRRYPFDRFREFLIGPTGKARRPFSHGTAPTATPTADRTLAAEDAAVVEHLLRSHNRFPDLWRGDSSGYASPSHADWAAASILASCGLDSDRILNILWCSGLRREKWDRHSDYLENTVAKAMEHVAKECPQPLPSDKESLSGSESTGSASAAACPPVPPDVRDSAGSDSGDDDENEEHLTELGNSRQLVHYHGQEMRYCFAWKQWLVWDGRRWREDETGAPELKMKETIARLYRSASEQLAELGSATSPWKDAERAAEVAKVRALLNHCLRSEKAQRLRAALSLAQSEPGIPILPKDMDRDPWLLNVLNGTLDLRTGHLREHRRQDLITKLAPVEYLADAKAPLWLQFLDRILASNTGLIAYLQRVIGYCLTGDVSEQCLWFCHGKGANGKTTFLITVKDMLGDYALQAVSDLLMAKNTEAHPTERADLFGRRFIATIETEEGKRMAEALMKQLTGGDPIRARKMRQDFVEFMPTHKIFLAANHKPVIRGTDFAAWRRIKLIPFTVTIPEGEKDKSLATKLRSELPGILAWAVQGCLAWQRDGLGEPDEVVQATADYRKEQDSVQAFLEECCVLDPEGSTRSSVLLEAYQRWSGDRLITIVAFRERLNDKGFRSSRGTGGGYYWRGIHLSLPGEQVKVSEGNPDSFSRGVMDREVTGIPSPTFTRQAGTVIRPAPEPVRNRPP